MKSLFWSIAIVIGIATAAQAQDPQAILNGLIQQHVQQNMQQRDLRQQNEMMRLELDRLDLEEQLRYRRASDAAIQQTMSRYCPPAGEPPCRAQPPQALLNEAMRRGLIEMEAPSVQCQTFGDGMGGGITNCHGDDPAGYGR
jgi:hypothetical protein